MEQAPPNHEASAGPTNPSVSASLPSEVVQCLNNARFLHLATCTSLHPHVSLMNYTYLPSTPYSPTPSIIMTTNPTSTKTRNLVANPNVSLLVHDWVSPRPPTTTTTTTSSSTTNGHRRASAAADERAPLPAARAPHSLAALLLNLNTSALSSISATIDGEARLVASGTEEERYLKRMHLENNTFGDEKGGGGGGGAGRTWDEDAGDGGRGCYIEGDEVRVVVVRIKGGRVADWKGTVRDWSLVTGEAAGGAAC